MAKYRLKETSYNTFSFELSGKRLGWVVRQADGRWKGTAHTAHNQQIEKFNVSARETFLDLVTALNRISLCGRDDPDAAKRSLDALNDKIARSNAEVVRSVNERNAQAGFTVSHVYVANRGRSVRI